MCEPSKDDVIFKAPITPIKLVLSDPETTVKLQYKEIASPKIHEKSMENIQHMPLCACCDEEMLDAFHTCSNVDDISKISETEMDEPVKVETCVPERNVPKLKKLYDRKIIHGNPYFTYCTHAINSHVQHDIEYQLCQNCMSYICSYCIDDPSCSYCCDDPEISSTKYDNELISND